MGGDGTIGGGRSVTFDFKIQQPGGGPNTPAKQHWKGTDPDSATPATPSTPARDSVVTVTFLKVPRAGPRPNSSQVDVAEGEGDVIKIDWT